MGVLPELDPEVAQALRSGAVIPAHPLALDARRRLDERRQRALTRYYRWAGAGGVAVGVHTTQFAIRDPAVGLYEPVLALAAETLNESGRLGGGPMIRVAGLLGRTEQAVAEAETAVRLGYHLGLLGYAGFEGADTRALLDRARAVSQVMPLMGFYLQPAVGGVPLSYDFWREFCRIENVMAIKVAPFDRYRTLDVMRAVCDSGRAREIALYTGNDDSIVVDLLTKFSHRGMDVRFAGGLLGHWAMWTRYACNCWSRSVALRDQRIEGDVVQLLDLGLQVTDANAAVFDARNGFAGCIPGIHEVLRRQGLLEGIWCLDENEGLSPGQLDEIDRVCRAYPHLDDTDDVAEALYEWLR